MRIKSAFFKKLRYALSRHLLFRAIGIGLLLWVGGVHPALAAGRQYLSGHMPAAISNLQPLGRLPGATTLQLAIGLPLRNETELDNLLRQIYDPASPEFRQYLTPEQFTERFGPTEQDYQAVIDFAKANGLTVTGTHPNRVVLDVSGSVADIERVFHVSMHTYAHPKEARTFYAPDTEPSLDLAVPVLHVSGLDNYSLPHPADLRVKKLSERTANATPNSGSGPGGGYMGNDFRQAYIPGVSLTGSGQSVALVEFDGYVSNDIEAYIKMAGLTNYTVNITNVPVNGGISVPGTNNGEVCLDIETVIAMAPGISTIFVYEAPNGTAWSTMLSSITNKINNTLPRQISSSWNGGSPDPVSEGIFKQMASEGQTYFNAVGDINAFTGSVPYPSDSTNVVEVGGTTLSTTGPGGAWDLETTWDWGAGTGSSGGISPTYSIPVWQKGINMTTNQGSTSKRNTPDLALTADNIFIVADTNQLEIAAGTSAAAPLWAAYTALVNQQAVAGGKSTVGFINPAIYAIGKSANYTSDFNDIVTGNNFWDGSTTKFSAVPGYDLCTGWGTPAGENLIDALATVSDALAVAPGRGFASSGPAGGAFTVSSQNLSLTNAGAASLNWSLINTSLWLAASPTSGTLTPGGAATTVTVSLTPSAYNLSAGIYTASVLFTNQTSHAVRTRRFAFLVGQQMIQNGGFEYGTLSYWMQTGPVNSYSSDYIDNGLSLGNPPNYFLPHIPPHSGNYLMTFGQQGSLGYISQTLSTVSNQAYLVSLWFNSPNVYQVSEGYVTASTPNEFSVSWNGTTLFNQTNIAEIGWTNLQYVVRATSPSTVLQFGGRDDPWFLGLDDVTVTPIPRPVLQSPVETGGKFKFSWNSMASVVYQSQYATNLLQANWTPFSTNTGTGLALSVTNSLGSDSHRFYRVIVP
ncbi:MAG: protease pro-enzyme activation domain-containing protein [Limisphaerales bacterium]